MPIKFETRLLTFRSSIERKDVKGNECHLSCHISARKDRKRPNVKVQ